jgi:IclR family KDG regulon transcriptional repressor
LINGFAVRCANALQSVPPNLCEWDVDVAYVDSEILRAELQDIRRLGYAVDLGGYLPGVNAVGAPIRDQTHKVVASLGIVGPASRLKEEKLTFCTIHVQEAAAEMSRSLGWNRR